MNFNELTPANENETLQRRVLRLINGPFRQDAFTDEGDKEKVALLSAVLNSLLQPGLSGTIGDEYVGKEFSLVFVDKEGIVQHPPETIIIPSNPEELLRLLDSALSPTAVSDVEVPLGHFSFSDHVKELKKHEDVANEFEKLARQQRNRLIDDEDCATRSTRLKKRLATLLGQEINTANATTIEILNENIMNYYNRGWLTPGDFEIIKTELIVKARQLSSGA